MSREITFVESMKGHVSGSGGGSRGLELRGLVVRVRPVPGPDDGLPGVLTGGTVRYDGREHRVTGGSFVALAANPQGGRSLRYHIRAQQLDIVGVKHVTGRPWRWWRDTTRMRVTLSTSEGRDPATGTVRIGWWAFARQLTTFRGRPADIAAFVARFAGRLMLTA